jgi:hypothetical protein
MRRTTFGVCAAMVALAGCGSSSKFANKPRPATPVDLTVYINNSRVSVSPASVGAGEVIFIVTNQADRAVSLSIHQAGSGGSPFATTGPIQPQATAQVTVDFSNRPGTYTVASAGAGQTQAQQATAPKIAPAALHIGKNRSNSSNTLLQP